MIASRRYFLQLAAAAAAVPALPRLSSAQSWPAKNIKAIVPFSAGSTIDIVARLVFEPLAAQLGSSIVTENRGGAGGTIGTAVVSKADPDGNTLLINSSAQAGIPAMFPKAPFHAANDFAGVTPIGTLPNVTVVAPNKYKTLQELVAAAKAKPGNISFASAGVGSATHLSAERLRVAAGIDVVHIPFRGSPEGLTEVMTGRVDFFSVGMSAALPFIRDGQLRALAVSTPKRVAALPDVPTTIEAGYPNSDYNYWMGMFVPVKTPKEIIDRLHAETQKALQNANVKEKLNAQGIEPMPMSPSEFDAFLRQQIELHLALFKAAGIKTN